MVYDGEVGTVLNPNVSLQRDINFINGEIIALNDNGTYTKYSNVLKAVSVVGMTKESYIDFWKKQYNKPKYANEPMSIEEIDRLNTILAVVEEKFKSGLTDKATMINLIKTSNDYSKDKTQALQLLGVKVKSIKEK